MALNLQDKKNRIFLFLSGIFITNALLAEIIGAKIFSMESALGFPPAHIPLFGFTMDFNLTAGAIIWPLVFITTDLINEYFGKQGVRLISFLTAGLITFAFFVLFVAIHLPPASWWTDTNKSIYGDTFDVNAAFGIVLGQGLRIIIGSLTAFLVGQFVDVYVFSKLRQATQGKWLWLRSTGSTLVSQLVDSYIVLVIAFYGTLTLPQIIAIGTTNYFYKFTVAILLTPLIYAGHALIDRYLGQKEAVKVIEEASEKG